VDLSEASLRYAEESRGDVPASRLRYIRRDLRQPIGEQGFDAAYNIFTSLDTEPKRTI
jgi:hypothetical protein